ncbi:MAG: CehA/McbA family metallohydrolase [Abitibacteriaceae bacterium]|nr:CehA/McbA family metallohydrolase [Abditibacteriaceae bacterium]
MPLTLQSSYLTSGFTWLRGNLHAHTNFTDGAFSPEEVIALYEKQGYDFLAISDHDKLVPPTEYQSLTQMVLIPADEVTANGPHLLGVQIKEVIEPATNRQQAVDAITTQGGFAILNHPNWRQEFNHWPQELMQSLNGYGGIEIYNGVIEREPGSSLALDRWDRLLSSGRRVWGYAHDDFHAAIDLARGWNVVQAAERSVWAICNALRQGQFYASTGVEITQVQVAGNSIAITAPDAQRIRFVGEWGKEILYANENYAHYEVTGAEGSYIRVECYGAGIKAAWTQPIYLNTE